MNNKFGKNKSCWNIQNSWRTEHILAKHFLSWSSSWHFTGSQSTRDWIPEMTILKRIQPRPCPESMFKDIGIQYKHAKGHRRDVGIQYKHPKGQRRDVGIQYKHPKGHRRDVGIQYKHPKGHRCDVGMIIAYLFTIQYKDPKDHRRDVGIQYKTQRDKGGMLAIQFKHPKM